MNSWPLIIPAVKLFCWRFVLHPSTTPWVGRAKGWLSPIGVLLFLNYFGAALPNCTCGSCVYICIYILYLYKYTYMFGSEYLDLLLYWFIDCLFVLYSCLPCIYLHLTSTSTPMSISECSDYIASILHLVLSAFPCIYIYRLSTCEYICIYIYRYMIYDVYILSLQHSYHSSIFRLMHRHYVNSIHRDLSSRCSSSQQSIIEQFFKGALTLQVLLCFLSLKHSKISKCNCPMS